MSRTDDHPAPGALDRLAGETLVPLIRAGEHMPPSPSGRPKSQATLWRWARDGYRGVVLETLKVGSGTYTSVEAIRRFMVAVTAARTA